MADVIGIDESRARRLNALNASETLDFAALAQEPGGDEYDWLIEGFLERRTRMLMAGPPGSGKSLIATTMAAQGAAGLPILCKREWTAPVPFRTLYVEMEMGRRTVRRRVRKLHLAALRAGNPVPAGSLKIIRRVEGLNLGLRSNDAKDMLTEVEAFEPDLVVFDPLYRMAETDALTITEARPLIRFIDKVREDFGAATLTVHHSRKRGSGAGAMSGDDIYGSASLQWWPETAIVLERTEAAVDMTVTKSRDDHLNTGEKFPLRFGGSWPIGMPDIAPIDETAAKIMDLLRIKGARSANTIIKELNARRGDVLDAIRNLDERGAIRRTGSGPRTLWAVTEGGETSYRVGRAFAEGD